MEKAESKAPKARFALSRISPRTRAIALRAAVIALFMVTIGAAFGIGAYLTLRFQVSVPEISVPDLARLDFADAEARAESLRLRVEIAGRRHDPTLPAGKVLEQMPQAGNATKPGRTIKLIVSEGAETAAVPDMATSSLRRAQLALRAEGLSVQNSASVNHPSVELGRVVAQQPPAGASVLPGGGVSLLLSAGPERRAYVMPSLSGRDARQVREALERAGFRRVRLRAASGGRVSSGMRVVRQRPEPGRRVTVDDRILLDVGVLSLSEAP